jgi:hypothetical protein
MAKQQSINILIIRKFEEVFHKEDRISELQNKVFGRSNQVIFFV